MSTQINVTVGSGGLPDKAKQQQEAARLAQLERERTRRVEAEAKAQREAKQADEGKRPNGQPQFGVPPQKPRPQDEPAAFRSGQGLNLGHLWSFGDTRQDIKSTGIYSAESNGSSRTVADDLRGRTNNLLLGCGDGISWSTVENVGYDGAPSLPSDTFFVNQVTPRIPVSFISPPTADNFHVGRRKGGSAVNTAIRFFDLALPCGKGNFIYIYGFSSIWDSFETEASYAAKARYVQSDPFQTIDEYPFFGFFNPQTGSYQSELPDTLSLIKFVEGSIQTIDFTGYRGKERRFSAYVCNNSSIRQINIPTGIEALLNGVCPEPVDATRTVSIYSFGDPDGTFVHNIYSIPNPAFSVSGNTGLKVDVFDALIYTPQLFKSINDNIQFTDPGNIKTIPEKLFRGLADRSDGAWSLFKNTSQQPPYPWMSNFYREGSTFYYALWANKNEEPNLQIYDPAYAPTWAGFPRPKRVPKATLKLKDNRIPRNGSGDNIYGPQYYNNEQLKIVWDWDDPAYCRSMCKALGFSDTDLTP